MSYTQRWEPVENTVCERLVDNSLLHTLTLDKKILKQTKILNYKLKRKRNLREYKQFVFLKRQAVKECKDSNAETDDESDLDYECYKKIHTDKSGHRLRTYLRSCVRQPPPRAKKKSPQVNSKTLNKSSTLSKSSKSLSVGKFTNYLGQDISKYLLRSRREVPKIERTTESPSREIISRPSKSDINYRDNVQTDDYAVKKIKNIEDANSHIATADDSIGFDSDCKLAVISNSQAINCPEQITLPEMQDDTDNELGITLEFDDSSHESGNRKQNEYDVNNTFEDDVKTSIKASISPTDSKMGIPELPLDILEINDKKIKEEVDVNDHENGIDDFTDNVDRDSGNNSFSDTDVLDDLHRMSAENSVPKDDCDNGTINYKQTSQNTREKIVTIKSDEATSGVILCENFNTSQSEWQSEISSKNEKLPDSNLDNETSREFGLSENHHENSNDEFCVETVSKNARKKLKILATDSYKKGHETFNERRLRKSTKLRTISDADCETSKHLDVFGVLHSKDEQPLRNSEPNEDCNFTLNESSYLNSFVDAEDCSNRLTSTRQDLNKFRESEFSPAAEDQLQSDAFSEKCTSSEIQLQSSNRSLDSSISSVSSKSYHEDVKDSFKKQLLTEIESRLIHNQHNGENKSGSSGEEFFSTSSPRRKNINKSTNEPLKTINAQSSKTNGSFKKCNSLKVIPQNKNKRSNLGECLLPSESKRAKRRIVDSKTDHHLSVNSSCASKGPRQHTNEQLEVISHEHGIPEDSPNPLQSDKSKKVAHSPKRRHRPRTLQEFAVTEAVNQNTTKAYFRLKDISDDDEIWIMDVPKMINPKDLESQTIVLGGKSVLRFGDDCYKVSSKPSKGDCNLSCVLTTSKRNNDYKILNIRSKGRLKFRQKISDMSDSKLVPSEPPSPKTAVPFPKNLKIRHPLFGATYEDKTS